MNRRADSRRWVVVIEAGPGEREELDVTGRTEQVAHTKATQMLMEEYDADWHIVAVHRSEDEVTS